MILPILILAIDLLLLASWEKRRRNKRKLLAWYWWIIGPTHLITLSIACIIMISFTAFFIHDTFPIGDKRTEAEIGEIAKAISRYMDDTGQYPESIDQIIGKNPIRKEWKTDYWRVEYQIVKSKSSIIVTSAGSDMVFDTSDDIRTEIKKSLKVS